VTRMIPDQVSEHVQSSAERRMFDRIREGLSDKWTALHSLGIAHHASKPWAEIDFVLIGPPGVICLEVKGGRISREAGEWVFTDRAGNRNRKREGPFEQVGSASSALHNWLRSNVAGLGSHFVAYAVATPDSPWRVTGPDIEPKLVYDETNAGAPFEDFIDRVVQHWRGLVSDRIGLSADPVDEATQRRIVESVRGDFDFRPSIRARVRNVNEDLLSLTKEQYRVLDGLKENQRVVVRGGAGTGKTLLAIEEADRAVKEGKRVVLLCSSARLGDYLARATSGCTYVGHLHGLMKDVVRRAQRTSQLPDADKSDLLTLFYPEQTLEGLADLEELGTIDVLIVDEAQDLLQESYLDVFDGLLDGGLAHGAWRFFLDPVQNIFDVMHTPALQRVMAHEPAQFTLTVNCRNTHQIAVHTSLLCDVDLPAVLEVQGENVDQEWYSDKRDLRRQVSRYVNRLLGGGLSPHDIAILGPYRLENSALSDGLIESAYPISDKPVDDRSHIAYSSISGFKGLEADAVIVIEVADLLTNQSRSAQYVGTSRARALLSVFTNAESKDDYDELARRLGERLKEMA
jgi:hypothetical protein